MPTWPAKTNYATGDVLTAAQMQDIGNALNSLQSAQYAAGKNKLINGDFTINQRNFTSATASNTYTFDRWLTFITGDGTATYTPQTFTPGTAPVTGYEGANFYRVVTASQTSTAVRTAFRQRIEDVRNFAGQTITVSFWAKAASGTPKIGLAIQRVYGTGGSPSSAEYLTPATPVTISTSWTRYSFTISIPSLSGKTLGTDANSSSLGIVIPVSVGSDFTSELGSIGIQNNTFDIWGVQAEAGSVATAFQTATGTLAGELAACQRYYFRYNASNVYTRLAWGSWGTTTSFQPHIKFPVTMRIPPSSVEYSTLTTYDTVTFYAVSAVALDSTGTDATNLIVTTAASTQYRFGYLLSNNSTAGYIGFNSEL